MKVVRVLAMITLGFLGVTSLLGGIPLILDPSGGWMHMPLSLLEHSPFHTFLIPGILLAVGNGLLSVVILASAARRVSGYGNLVAFEGCVIGGWITGQVLLLRVVIWAHYAYWGVGLVLVVCGLVLRRDGKTGRPILVIAR